MRKRSSDLVLVGVVLIATAVPRTASGQWQTHSASVADESATWKIDVDGTADHIRMGGWKLDPGVRHNPTRSLRISNEGDFRIINPRITTDTAPDWFDIDHIIAEFVKPGMTDEEKSLALWQWIRLNLSDGPTFKGPLWGDTRSMTRFMNTCGTGACGTYHIVMPVIGRQAGLRTWSGCFADCSHAVQHNFFNGQKRFLDAHIPHENGQPGGWLPLKLNNREFASVEEIMADRYLIERAGGGPERFGYAAYFGPGCSFHEMKQRRDPRTMELTLRPGESITWNWYPHQQTWKNRDEVRKTDRHGTGFIEYAPSHHVLDRTYDLWATSNIESQSNAAGFVLKPKDPAQPGVITCRMDSPYPITGIDMGGRIFIDEGGKATLAYSLDGKTFKSLQAIDKPGPHHVQPQLLDGPPFREPEFTHTVWFRITLQNATTDVAQGPGRLRFRTYFQAYRPSLPSLHAGLNTIRYQGEIDRGPWITFLMTRGAYTNLVNGGFEIEPTANSTPSGWKAFGKTDGTQIGRSFNMRPAQGKAFFAAIADWDNKTGGIYQRVRWERGKEVSASVYVSTRGDTTVSSGCRIGLDLTGGIDPESDSVVWSDFTRSEKWTQIHVGPIDVPPGTEHVTVFLNHRHADDGGRFNLTAFDACVLMNEIDPFADTFDMDVPQSHVKIMYDNRDLPDLPVPQPPAKAIHPTDGGTFGFSETMEWTPASLDACVFSTSESRTLRPPLPRGDHRGVESREKSRDQGEIDNYEIVISARPDLAWPVTSNTHRITNNAKPEFALVFPDVLNHDQRYYWCVRGQSKAGVWGDWSETWSFVAQGPGSPRNLTADSSALTWQPPVNGTPVDHYEIYASNAHGFSPLRADEVGDILGHKVDRPANLVTTTTAMQADISAHDEVFWRMTAVDKDGNRSVPTPIVALPNPALPAMTLPAAMVGRPYDMTLRSRLRRGRHALALRKGVIIDRADSPTFTIANPDDVAWLKVDGTAGQLAGTPPDNAVGTHTVEIKLDNGRGGTCRQQYEIVVKGR